MKRTVSMFIAGLAVLMLLLGCRKDPAKGTHEEKVATVPKKIQPLFTTWKLDVNASSEMNSRSIEKTTGIKSDVKFDKDVGKAAQFLARTLFFTFEKGKLTRAYQETYGEGLLSSSTSGFFTVDDDARSLTLKDAQAKESAYSIDELTSDKLVLAARGGSYEVYRTRGAQFTPASSTGATATATPAVATVTSPKEAQPDTKNLRSSYRVGEKVAGRWMGSSWYMATITKKSGDTYDVSWGDGTSGKVTPANMVPIVGAKQVKVGDHVTGCWMSCKGRLYMGTVQKVDAKKPGTTFTVQWDDGTSSDVKGGDLTLF